MSEPKHTPGPWEEYRNEDAEFRFAKIGVSGPDGDICYCDMNDASAGEYQTSEIEANARLIAAAPEMLAALEQCDNSNYTDFEINVLAACETGMGEIAPDLARRYQVVRAAIAKANGGAA